MKISYGNSRYDSYLKAEDISWDAFCEKLKAPKRTNEKYEEFISLTSKQQNEIKDVGGFVAGLFLDGHRRKTNLISRSMITLDLDYGTRGIDEVIFNALPFKCCVHSTHRHTTEKPRLRIIVPLTREISADEYEIISYKIASQIGCDFFDKASYEAERFMYWPSVSADGEYFFKEKSGLLLSPDEFGLFNDKGKNEGNKNIIDLFCRTYSISDVIEKYLPGIYVKERNGRYKYSKSSSPAGAIVIDDRYLYSFHNSDPAYGKLRDSFDLVRVHLFSELDGNSEERTDLSFQAMLSFALNDKKVDAVVNGTKEEWENDILYDKNGKIKDSFDNIVTVLRNDSLLKSVKFNLHSGNICVNGSLPWKQIKYGWNDTDYASLKVYLSRKYGFYPSNKIKDALVAVSAERSFHPVLDFLDSLPAWDGIQRVKTLLIDYLGAENSSYVHEVTLKTLVAAISRVRKPGIKFDSVLILNGPQGIGKSTLFSQLGGAWFSDSLTISDMKDKSAAEKLQGYWILEMGELSGMRKTDVEIVKSFVSRSDDKYRASYGAVVESHQRQNIIVGTTNSELGFLRDVTGNRRFWPVYVSGKSDKKPWDLTVDDIQQIWAEAMIYYEKGTSLHIEDDEIVAQARVQQNQAMENDDREGLVRMYLETDIPDDWERFTLYERREFLQSKTKQSEYIHKHKRERVCNIEIWSECFGRNPSDMKKSDSYEISSIMKKIFGWSSELSNKVYNFSIYGKQRAYFLKAEEV